MLLTCIKNENRKLRRSVIWLACLLLPVIPAVMGTGNYLGNLQILTPDWYSLWTQITLFYAIFFYAPLIGLYAAYLWRLEHFHYNWNTLMTMPVPVRDICLGKLFLLCKVSLITQVWTLILFFIGGKYAGLPGLPPAEIILWAVRGLFAAFAIGALQLLLSMVIRNFAIPIGIALAGSIVGLLLTSSEKTLGLLWPYALMLLGMNSNKREDAITGITVPFLAGSLIYFLLFLGVSVLILKKKDIKA